MRLIQFTLCLLVFASPSLGEPRYQIDGNTLTFNMGVPGGPGEFTGQLEYYDLREIGELIFESVGVEVLKVTGPGGSMTAAREITNKVLYFCDECLHLISLCTQERVECSGFVQ